MNIERAMTRCHCAHIYGQDSSASLVLPFDTDCSDTVFDSRLRRWFVTRFPFDETNDLGDASVLIIVNPVNSVVAANLLNVDRESLRLRPSEVIWQWKGRGYLFAQIVKPLKGTRAPGLARVKKPVEKNPGFFTGFYWLFSKKFWKKPAVAGFFQNF